MLVWYYGKSNASLVASFYPDGNATLARGVTLSIAIGLYKLAKNPNDPAGLPRLRRCLDDYLAQRT